MTERNGMTDEIIWFPSGKTSVEKETKRQNGENKTNKTHDTGRSIRHHVENAMKFHA